MIAEFEIFGEAGKQLRDEPRPQDVLGQGADLVMFSGDKLLGGPQSGIIAGTEELVSKVRSHPLARTANGQAWLGGTRSNSDALS